MQLKNTWNKSTVLNTSITQRFKIIEVAQTVKRLPTMRETWVQSLGQEDPLEKEMATHSSTLAWKIPWTEKPGRLQSMGSQRVGHDWSDLAAAVLPIGSFSRVYVWINYIMCVHALLLRCVRLFVTPWTIAYKAPPFMGFFRQEWWSGFPFPSPGDLPDPRIETRSPAL